MYNVTSGFTTAVKQPSRTFGMRIDIGSPVSYTLGKDDVISWELEDSLGTDSMPGIGGVVSSSLKLKLLRTANVPAIWGMMQIRPYLSIGDEWVPMGVFFPDNKSVVKNDFSIEMTCYDKLYDTEFMEYYTGTTYPAPLRNVATELQNYGIGITFQLISQLPDIMLATAPKGTVRQVLGEFAELAGANCVMTRDGKVAFRNLTNTNFVTFYMGAGNYIDFKLASDAATTIDKLICKKADEAQTLTYGAGTGATLEFENDNIVSVADLQAVYDSCYPLTYYAYVLKAQGFPHLDTGDMFLLTDNKGVQHQLMVMTHKLSYSGGLISEFTVKAPQAAQASTGSNGGSTITAQLGAMRANAIEADRIYATRFEAAEGNIGNLEAKVLTADKAHLSFASIDTATIEDGIIANAMIADAAITNAKIDRATANKLVVGEADIASLAVSTAKIKDAAITNAKIDRASANKLVVVSADIGEAAITNAKIDRASVNKLVVAEADIGSAAVSSAKIKDAAITTAKIATGAITNALIGTAAVDTAQIADGSITDAKIVNLTASKITAGTIDAADINVVNLNAANITVGTINGTQISNGAVDATKLASAVNTSITTAQATANTAISNLNSLQIGGRNLLPNSTFDRSMTGWDSYMNGGTNTVVSGYSGHSAINIARTGYASTTRQGVLQNLSFPMAAGETYIVSAWIKVEIAPDAENNQMFLRTAGNGDNPVITIPSTTPTGTWTKFTSSPFTITSAYTTSTFYILLGKNGSINISSIKLEKANRPTDWTPAPEDTDAGIAAAQATANSKNAVYYQTSAPTGGTYKTNDVWFDTDDGNKMYVWSGSAWTAKQFGSNAIQAGAITTGLIAAGCISADQIAAGSITAGKIAMGAIAADKLNLSTHFLC